MIIAALSLALAQAAGAEAPAATPPSPPRCEGETYEAFDFWVGEWDVYPNGKENKVADSLIEKLYSGCGVRENWMPIQGTGGGSLNAYLPETGRWHQFWVGSSPGRVEFIGGPVEGKMVMTGHWRNFGGAGVHALVRQTYTAMDADTVRQHGEASVDEGLTWTTSYDLIYRRKQPES